MFKKPDSDFYHPFPLKNNGCLCLEESGIYGATIPSHGILQHVTGNQLDVLMKLGFSISLSNKAK